MEKGFTACGDCGKRRPEIKGFVSCCDGKPRCRGCLAAHEERGCVMRAPVLDAAADQVQANDEVDDAE